jgi:uncharacterized membrane protein
MIGRMVGMRKGQPAIRAYGLRELATGIGILATSRPRTWLWSRVAGDVVDMASLGRAYTSSGNGRRNRAALGMAAVAGVTALDVWCADVLGKEARQPERRLHPHGSVIVDRSPEDCYAVWRDLENLPRFISHLQSARVTGDRTSHWIVTLPGGLRREWDSELITDEPGRRIVWRSLHPAGATITLSVEFERAGGGRGALVRVAIEHGAGVRAILAAAATLVGQHPEHIIAKDLRRFKQAMETGEVIRTEGQPHGRRGRLSWLDRVAR